MFTNKKKPFYIVAMVLLQLFLVVAIVAAGTEFSLIIDNDGDVGRKSSLTIVDGFPASAYYDNDNEALKYVRALDAQGQVWGIPQTLVLGGDIDPYGKLELRVANGNPAIAFYDHEGEDLYFVRALDAQGINWGVPICVDCSSDDKGEELSMEIINGNPAIAYRDYDNDYVLFVRATNASGTAWATPVLVSAAYNTDIELVEANGNPAVSYFNKYDDTVDYVLADDVNGTSWGSVQVLDTLTDYDELAMAIVNGNPAVAYYDYDNEIMYYIRASNADGTSWGSRVVVRANDYVDSYHELFVIDGYPTIAYQRNSVGQQDDDLALIQASDANGTSWKEPRILLSSGDIGMYNSLISLGGDGLGITTYDGTNDVLYYFSYFGAVEPEPGPKSVSSVPANSAILTTSPSELTVIFDKDISTATATDTDNYILLKADDGSFKSGDCDAILNGAGVAATDTRQTITAATYTASSFTSTLTLGSPLPIGDYRLLVCGTTSIQDLAGNDLNDGASDSQINFTVRAAATSLPFTGFPRGRITSLLEQPAAKAYTETAMMLNIPKLGVSMPIVGVPQSESGWDVTWLGNSVGYLAGSAFPTWAGNTVITGHAWDAYNQLGIFSELKTLSYGDQVQIQAWGMTYIYEVRESKLVTKKSVSVVFQSEDYDWVTLVTCEFYNPFSGEYLFRRAVRAVLVSVK